uniref:Ig-like domain-containing protein n=1 Tax=Magnetospirillum sp. 15-1 TaxID=1979370 RepID=UPI0018D5692D
MADNNNSNPPNNQHAEDQHDGAGENAQQSLDDLTVLQNVQNQNMGDARLNVARSADVSDTQLGNLANVQQGSTGNPQVQNLHGIAGGANIAIDVNIDAAKDGSVAPPELQGLAADVEDAAPTVAANSGGAKALNVQELPDLAKPDAEFKPQDAVVTQPVNLAPPGGFTVNTQVAAPAGAVEAAKDNGPDIQAAVNHAPVVDAAGESSTLQAGTVTGHVLAHDPDGDTMSFHLVDANGQVTDSITNDHGTLTIDPTTGEYTFVANEATKHLTDKQSVSDLFQVQVSDSHGGTSTTSVHVNIVGTDDAPTVSVSDVTTADDHSAKTGSAVGADIDTGDVSGATPASADTLHYALVDGNGNHVSSLTTAHGTVSINADTGEYTFTPNADAAHLVKDQTVDDSFKVVSIDNGGLASDPASVKVTITGSDDAPTVTVHDLVTADDHSAIKGSAVGADVDTGDVAGATPAIADKLHYALVDGDGNHVSSLTTTHGTVSINADIGVAVVEAHGDGAGQAGGIAGGHHLGVEALGYVHDAGIDVLQIGDPQIDGPGGEH